MPDATRINPGRTPDVQFYTSPRAAAKVISSQNAPHFANLRLHAFARYLSVCGDPFRKRDTGSVIDLALIIGFQAQRGGKTW